MSELSPASSSPPPPRLQLQGITKRYPAVVANDGVSLTVQPGEIHAVLGENGAGKSTLMKIIYGAVSPDAGTLRWNGQVVQMRHPQQARGLGVSMVFQHFSLFDTLTAAENVWLGLDRSMGLAQVRAQVTAVATEYGLPVDVDRPVHSLSVGERQRVEIVRALLTRPQLLILDEPTSVLTPQAVEKLFVTLRQLSAQGCSILYISHKLHEIRALCSACTVMRAGRVTGTVAPRQETDASLSRLMIGAEPPALPPRQDHAGAVVLAVRNLSLPTADPFGVSLTDIDLRVQSGEIVGIAGVSGNGQQALMAALSGEDAQRIAPGTVQLLDQDISRARPGRRRHLGLHFVPEERLGRGTVPTLSLAHNLLLTRHEAVGRAGWLRTRDLADQARGVIERFRVKAPGPQAVARSLSGGNLQKYIVGREISARPKVLLIAQPTWGVDVGAAAHIRSELLALRDAGCAVLVVSEELDELFELADRLHVMARGRLSPSVATRDATVEMIGTWMSGRWPGAPEGADPAVTAA